MSDKQKGSGFKSNTKYTKDYIDYKKYKDFKTDKYAENIDDQKHLLVKNEEQKFLTKDYMKNLKYAFVRVDSKTKIPSKFNTSEFSNDPTRINKYLEFMLLNGKYFSNKELSYMRKDVVNKRLWRHVYGPAIKLFDDPPNTFIDITANIGGDVICAGLQPDIKNIIGYEMQKNVAEMLDKIIELYGIKNKTIIRNEKFTKNTLSIYKEEFKNAIVIIDPPFEIGNNSDNFNLSIDSRPIYYIVEDILKAGAAFVILSMPQNFEYNIRFAKDNEQRVSVYKTKIDLKMYLVGKNKKMPHGNSYMINSKSYINNDNYDTEFEKLYQCSIDKIN